MGVNLLYLFLVLVILFPWELIFVVPQQDLVLSTRSRLKLLVLSVKAAENVLVPVFMCNIECFMFYWTPW